MSLKAPLRPTTPGRNPSDLTLTSVRSTDAHPPHHAHSDEPEGDDDLRSPIPPDKDSEGRAHGVPVVDIEHVPVDDDPREWSATKKNIVLTMMTLSVVSSPSYS